MIKDKRSIQHVAIAKAFILNAKEFASIPFLDCEEDIKLTTV